MPARAIWKGTLRLGSVQVPVKLFSAAVDKRVHFRLLHGSDQEPVEQRMLHAETKEPVERGSTRLGYRVAAGSFVVLTDAEREALEPAASRDIELLRFVPSNALSPEWYVRPYYLAPDGDSEAYAALRRALADEDKIGIARWVMRKKAYVGALHVAGEGLALTTLHHSDEIISPKQIAPKQLREPNAKELAMAEQLVGMFEGEFDPSAYHDEYRERVQALALAKARGKRPKLHKVQARRPSEGSLASVLTESLKQARKQKVA